MQILWLITFLERYLLNFIFYLQIPRCEIRKCCPGELLENFNWLPFPCPDLENAGHFKKFWDVFDQEPTEEHLPSNVKNVRKVVELEQVSY